MRARVRRLAEKRLIATGLELGPRSSLVILWRVELKTANWRAGGLNLKKSLQLSISRWLSGLGEIPSTMGTVMVSLLSIDFVNESRT